MTRYDAIVVGLGAFGSAATYHLAKAGSRVLGIDRHVPPHKFGSSHGDTRVTRAAIGEGVEYSQLAIRSNALWRELEAQTGDELFVQCGCLLISGRAGAAQMHEVDGFFETVRKAADAHGIALQEFPTGAAIRRRYPQFAAASEETALLDPAGGLLFVERCIRGHLKLAAARGADLLTGRTVVGYREDEDGVSVSTDDGRVHSANRLLIAAGAWAPRLVGGPLQAQARVTRQVLHWFEITGRAEHFDPAVCPTYIWQVDRPSTVYGFPLTGDAAAGVKIAHEEDHGAVEPDTVAQSQDRGVPVHADREGKVRDRLAVEARAGAVCLAVLGARFQALGGGRRGAGRAARFRRHVAGRSVLFQLGIAAAVCCCVLTGAAVGAFWPALLQVLIMD
jgi:sarcosine oxidase